MMTPLRFNDLFGVSVFPPVSSCQNSPSRPFCSQDLPRVPGTSPLSKDTKLEGKENEVGGSKESLASCVARSGFSTITEHQSPPYSMSSSKPIHFAAMSPRLYGFYDVEYVSQVKSSPVTTTRQSNEIDIDEAFLTSENDSYERKALAMMNDKSKIPDYDTSINIIQSDPSYQSVEKNDEYHDISVDSKHDTCEDIRVNSDQETRVDSTHDTYEDIKVNYYKRRKLQGDLDSFTSSSDVSIKRKVKVKRILPKKSTRKSAKPKRKYVRKPKMLITFPVSLPNLSSSGKPFKASVNLFEHNRSTRSNHLTDTIGYAPEKKRRLGPRSKTGCWTCRVRHKACPEERPSCTQCQRLGLECDYSSTRPDYMSDSMAQANKLREIKSFTSKHKKIHKIK